MDEYEFQKLSGVSRETLSEYVHWKNTLTHWNKKINLVSGSTIGEFWSRHAYDSWQCTQLVPSDCKSVLDMGAGAGFPGLAFAIAAKEHNKNINSVSLVESNGKKCNFLRAMIRERALPATVKQTRIEAFSPDIRYDVLTARAFAPLSRLLSYSLPFWHAGTLAIFPKGENWQAEVKEAQGLFHFSFDTVDSKTDENAKTLLLKNLESIER